MHHVGSKGAFSAGSTSTVLGRFLILHRTPTSPARPGSVRPAASFLHPKLIQHHEVIALLSPFSID